MCLPGTPGTTRIRYTLYTSFVCVFHTSLHSLCMQDQVGVELVQAREAVSEARGAPAKEAGMPAVPLVAVWWVAVAGTDRENVEVEGRVEPRMAAKVEDVPREPKVAVVAVHTVPSHQRRAGSARPHTPRPQGIGLRK